MKPEQSPASPVGAPLANGGAGAAAVLGGSGAMFDRIARRYDLLNRVMTFGIDQRWRRLCVEGAVLPERGRLLDVATGTADLAILAARMRPDLAITALDPSAGMRAVAARKLAAAGVGERVQLVAGQAETLDFADATFDAATMAFGIRNVVDRGAALRAMARVVRPGGRVVILEATEPPPGLLAFAARWHIRVVVPRLGAWLSGAPAEYRYLQRSIADFPTPTEFSALLRTAGLEVRAVHPLLLGVAHVWLAQVPPERGAAP